MAVVVTFNIAVMLNERIDTYEEVLSEGLLNGCLIFVNLLVPLAIVLYEVWQFQQRKSASATRPNFDEGKRTFDNPVNFEEDTGNQR